MGTTLAILGIFGFFAGLVLLVIGLIRKKKMKGGLVLGISIVVFIIGFIMVPTNGTESSKDSKDKEKVETAANPKEETPEEKAAREKKEAEEKALAEQKAKEEAEAKAKAEEEARLKTEQEAPVSLTWQDKVKEIATIDGTPTEKYDAVMLYAKDYPSTEAEIKEFEKYIITEYKSKNYIADINNAEYMLSNVFRANVINKFYGEVRTPINNFAFDFYQNTKYTYRGVETIDSSAVRSNERQMDKALKQMAK